MRGIKKLIVGGVLAVGTIVGVYGTVTHTQAITRECGSNSVIRCGVMSISELRDKYNSNYTSGTKTIFSYMGVSSSTVNKATYKSGYVTKDGKVVVGGKTVATSALSTGRSYVSGSTKHTISGTTFYTRKPSASFKSQQLDAYVFFDSDGRFIGAVLKVCGNVISGKPVEPKPEPVYKCDALSVDKTSAPLSNNSFTFKTDTTAKNGATVKDYIYDFGDGSTETTTSSSIKHSYAKTGTYTVKVTARFTVNGSTKTSSSTDCQKKVTVVEDDKPAVDIDKKVNGKEIDDVAVNETFTYSLVITNTGEVDLKNVVVTDKAPDNVMFISSSVGTITNNVFTYTIPSLVVKETVKVTITAKVTKYVANTIVNTACVNAPEIPGEKDDCDDANVKVKEPTVTRCDTTTDTIVSNLPVSQASDPRYTEDLSQCAKVKRCDTKTGNIVSIPKNDANDARYVDEDDDACKVRVCNPKTGVIIKVDKADKDKYEPVDSENCGDVKVCDPTTKTIKTVNKADADKYEDVNSASCDEPEAPVTPEEPSTPPELPDTGLSAEAIGSVVGLGSIVAASYYYIASRRS